MTLATLLLASTVAAPLRRCDALPALAEGRCSVEGQGGPLLVQGTLLLPDEVLAGGSLLIDEAGEIRSVGCGLSAPEPHRTLSCPNAVISPGLINLHDHLAYDNNSPAARPDAPYAHRHQWRLGQDGRQILPTSPTDSALGLTWVELRQALAGTTSVAGGAGSPGLLRNLDVDPPDPALQGRRLVNHTFPLGDAAGEAPGPMCAVPKLEKASVLKNRAYIAHVAEGVDEQAHEELRCLLGAPGGVDLGSDHTAFVHVVAETAPELQRLADRGASIIWSPRSNLLLYGATARVGLMRTLGLNLALGSDWTTSGSPTLGRELACAADYSRSFLDGALSTEDLWAMVTGNAARAAGSADRLGRLEVGRVGDLLIVEGEADPYAAVISAQTDDVVLVLRGGTPLWGDAALVEALDPGCEPWPEPVCGRARAVCLGEAGTSAAALLAANTISYPLYSCTAPKEELRCTPGLGAPLLKISDDQDGDGWTDPADNCPVIWNKPRPMDNGVQPDVDGDGLGDVCDPLPLGSP